MYAPKWYGATDSLSSWSSFRTSVTAYARRIISSPANRPPKLVWTFRRTDLSRRRRLRSTRVLKTANALRAENTRLVRDMKVMRNELKAARHNGRRAEWEGRVDREYAVLHDKLIALKEENAEVSAGSAGDGKSADRVRQHLAEVATFFNGQMSTINAVDSTWSKRHRTVMMERLWHLFTRNAIKMNEWVYLLVEMDVLSALN